jgi:hypothetical protein
MYQRSLADDAADCRLWAQEFEGLPEKAILLRLSSEFEALAEEPEPLSAEAGDFPYFAHRASQEVAAAVSAKHPKARLVHLKLAQRYEALSQAR